MTPLKRAFALFLSAALLIAPPALECSATAGRAASGARIGGALPVTPLFPAIPAARKLDISLPTSPIAAPLSDLPRSAAAVATPARQQLSLASDKMLLAATPGASINDSAAAFTAVFDGRTSNAETDAVLPGASGTDFGILRLPFDLPRNPGDAPQPPPPRQSLGRSARVGFLAAVAAQAVSFATIGMASALGYHFHGDYEDPFADTGIAPLALCAVFLGPVAEEIIFRGGLMGGLRAITSRLPRIGQFWVPAALSSLVFVAAHETSDPVLFAGRFAGSMLMSCAFHAEGITGSMFAHAFTNALFVLPVALEAALPPAAGVAVLALIPVSLCLARAAYKKIIAEARKKESGQLVAVELGAPQALLLAAALTAGFFALEDNDYWIVGALGWVIYALRRRLGSLWTRFKLWVLRGVPI